MAHLTSRIESTDSPESGSVLREATLEGVTKSIRSHQAESSLSDTVSAGGGVPTVPPAFERVERRDLLQRLDGERVALRESVSDAGFTAELGSTRRSSPPGVRRYGNGSSGGCRNGGAPADTAPGRGEFSFASSGSRRTCPQPASDTGRTCRSGTNFGRARRPPYQSLRAYVIGYPTTGSGGHSRSHAFVGPLAIGDSARMNAPTSTTTDDSREPRAFACPHSARVPVRSPYPPSSSLSSTQSRVEARNSLARSYSRRRSPERMRFL
jgi:hypothetical protein